MTKTLLSLGHGYSAQSLAERLLPLGWHIIGTTRSPERATALERAGIEPLLWPATTLPLERVTHVLSSVAPEDGDDPVLAAHGPQIARATHLEWTGYLSTTGVYGDHGGAWVDEDTALTPGTARGRARVAAEAAWQATAPTRLHILRLAGIYGPGRSPFERLRDGSAQRIVKPGQVFSRIHRDDIGGALHAAIQSDQGTAIYNLCDDDPAPPQDVIAYAAELLGMTPPPEIAFEAADLSPMARSFYSESKRVRNDRIKRDLRWQPLYPDYRSGLRAVLAAEG
ncbi:SDR family oxidoreductase [Roseibaca sp. Y0-43]|uniref:SDR family oxidoreductase n=1 Tax=Roseibaca sp. Y0-43 TaxID=2816854 RepID=UPI001D0CB2DB|nr:SDR family oxidoreductase [Roseibaca sp. Y0-43]MCC1482220.1 SDR family oxidoreductase [Roseibaca sp. Y0-43]